MGKYIEFFSNNKHIGNISFALSKKAMEQFVKSDIDAYGFLKAFSSNKNQIILKEKDDSDNDIIFYTNDISLRCSKSKGDLLIVGLKSNNLLWQNKAISRGIRIIPENISVLITVSDYQFRFLCNGNEVNSANEFPSEYNSGVDELLSFISKASTYSKDERIGERKERIASDKINRNYNNILDRAEKYSELFSQMERRKATDTPPITYYSVKASDYYRIDRLEYVFVSHSTNIDNYKVGSQVLVNDNYPAEITGIKIFGKDIEIKVLFHDQIDRNNLLDIGQMHLSYISTISDVQKGAINNLRIGKSQAKNLKFIIGDNSTEPYELLDEKIIRKRLTKELNSKQLEALKRAVSVKDILLVMGPPGTGKTSVIVELVRHLVIDQGLRVLISSQNNTAIDNVMKGFPDEKILRDSTIRIGTESRVDPEIYPFLYENKIKEYRKRIGDATESALNRITETMNGMVWKWRISGEFSDTQRDIQSCKDIFNRKVETKLIDKYLNVIRYLNAAYNQIKQQNILAQSIIKNNKKVKEYRPLPVIHFITDTGYESTKRKLMDQVKQYRLKQGEVEQAIVNYKRAKKEYTDLYNILYEGFVEIYKRELKFNADWDTIAPRIFNSNDASWLCGVMKTESMQPDDAIEYLKAESDRLRGLQKTVSEWKEYTTRKQNYAFEMLLLDTVKVVGATCIGINSQKRFDTLSFDVSVIDEAGQIQIQNALVPMSVAPKTIMFGDYQQIPPNLDFEIESHCRENGIDTKLLKKSFFEYLYEKLPEENKIMLDLQYRMPSQISDILSSFFYNGEYHACVGKKDVPGRIGMWKTPCIIIDTSCEKKRHEKKYSHYCNELEAESIRFVVSRILEDEIYDENEIHIIAPYKEQVKLIREKFEDYIKKGKFNEEIVNIVSTLDSYQGQENDLIIYSFTRSSTIEPESKRIGFLREVRRLNVAMSRCRQNLILVGDMTFLSSCQYMDNDDEGEPIYEESEKRFSDFIKQLMEYVSVTGTIVDCRQLIADLRK